MRMYITRRLSIGSLLAVFVLTAQPGIAAGQGRTQQTRLISPPFGVGPDQRATFTLFLSAGEPVRARVTLHDELGQIVAESSEAVVRAGAFHSFQFDSGDIHVSGEAATGRRQVRASCWIRVSQPWGRIGDLDAVLAITAIPTGVTDGTSTTIFFSERFVRQHHGTGVGGLASREAKDMLAGIAPGQSLRVSAFNADASDPGARESEPIRMQLNIYDADGTLVTTSRGVEIPSAHFRSVSVDRRDLPMTGDPGNGRAQVRVKPQFAFPAGWNGRVAMSLETVDAAGNTVDGPQCLVFFLGGIPGD